MCISLDDHTPGMPGFQMKPTSFCLHSEFYVYVFTIIHRASAWRVGERTPTDDMARGQGARGEMGERREKNGRSKREKK